MRSSVHLHRNSILAVPKVYFVAIRNTLDAATFRQDYDLGFPTQTLREH